MHIHIYGIALLFLIGYSQAFPRGAPSNICGRYIPGGHRNRNTPVGNPQPGPYALDVQPAAGGSYKVTLRGTQGNPFKGFVIQAMKASPSWKRLPEGSEDIVGTFQPNQSPNSFMSQPPQIRLCPGMGRANVITHSDSRPKYNVDVTWTPPQMSADPNYRLVATVVQDFDTFYVVQSDTVNTQGGSSQSTPGGSLNTNLQPQPGDNTILSPTGSPTGSSFLNPSQSPALFPGVGSGLTSQTGINGFTGSNTLTDSSTNQAVPQGSVFFSSQGNSFGSQTGMNGLAGADTLTRIPSNFSFSEQSLTFPVRVSRGGSLRSTQFTGTKTFSGLPINASSEVASFSSSGQSSVNSQFQPLVVNSSRELLDKASVPRGSVMFFRQGSELTFPGRVSGDGSLMRSTQLTRTKTFSGSPINASSQVASFSSGQSSVNSQFQPLVVNSSRELLGKASVPRGSVMFSRQGSDRSSRTGLGSLNTLLRSSASFPLALEVVEASTIAPIKLPSSPGANQPSNTVSPFQTSKTVKPFETSSTTDPFLSPSTVDPFLVSSSVDPFQSSSTLDFLEPSSTVPPFLPPTTLDPLQSSSTERQFLPPSTPKPFLTFNFTNPSPPPVIVDSFRVSGNIKPFQPPTTIVKTIESSEIVKSFIPPFQPDFAGIAFELTNSLNVTRSGSNKPPATPKPFRPPTTPDPLAPPPPIFAPPEIVRTTVEIKEMQINDTSLTDSVNLPVTRPVASIDLPITIDPSTSNTLPNGDIRVVLKTVPPPIEFGESLTGGASSSSSTFEVVSASLSDIMSSSGGSASSAAASTSETSERSTLRLEPVVNIINIPVEPSGQMAAVLNFSRSDGTSTPIQLPQLAPENGRFITVGRPLGASMPGQSGFQFGMQPGSTGATMFGQPSMFGPGQFRGQGQFGRRTTLPVSPFDRRRMQFSGQGQTFGASQFGRQPGQFRGTFGGAGASGQGRVTGTGAQGAATSGSGGDQTSSGFGFQQFASPMPSGFVGSSSQFGSSSTQFGQPGLVFAGRGPSFVSQGAIRQFRFGPQGGQVQTMRFPPQSGQFTTFRFGSQPAEFGQNGFGGSGLTQGQGQMTQAGQGFTTQTFGQTGGSDRFLTPVGV